nr:MAG TPA_asm: Tail tape measure [Caudoviricetes sp.]
MTASAACSEKSTRRSTPPSMPLSVATIRSQMVLNDGISGVLRKINTALNTTLNAFEQVQRASGRAVDTAQIQAARAALVQANREVDEMAEGYRRAAQQEEVLNKGLRNGTSAADGLLGKVKGIVATLAAGAGAKALLGLSDKLTSTTARLSFLVDDGGSVDELEQKIMASAQRSRAAYLDTASAIASMGANAGRAFESNDELIAFMEQVNKQFVIGGATAEGQSAAMLQLTQAMAAGALRGEELNSILENAPGIARAIESYMGVAEGSIKSYAEEGLITADVVKNALLSVADETNAKFESMPMTWAQICTKMQNTALAAFEPVLTRLNQVANSAQFNTVIDGAINGLAMLASVATGVLDLLINGASFVVDNWSWISPIVYGLVAAFIAYNAVALITNGINAAMALAEGVKAAALMMSTGATFAQTAAQYGLNAALAACPITWIVVLVIALVAAIYAACSAIAKFTGIANSGFGVICGGINVVVQFFVNLGLTIANIALGIWNALGACAQNIGIAFSNVISGVQAWFYNLLSTALTVVAGICEALNKLPFVDFDYSGITNAASDYAAKAAEASGNIQDFVSIGDAFNEGMSTFDTWQDGWVGDAFNAGANWGDGVASGISDAVGGLFDMDLGAATDYGASGLGTGGYGDFAMDDLLGNTGQTAANTGAAADALSTSTEELEYLRDIAERDAINRFTTAEVRIDMTGMTNRIEGGADLDGVISTLTDGFTEALLTAAEGVHA